jgi:CheY-like chemotaxis protein
MFIWRVSLTGVVPPPAPKGVAGATLLRDDAARYCGHGPPAIGSRVGVEGASAVAHVLIVDDSKLARALLTRRLEADGHTIAAHTCTREGCAASIDGVACAVLDLELGDGDGVEVAAALRARAPALPIAFFSGAPEGEIASRARAYGHVFAKPSELDKVACWVGEACVSRTAG